MQFIGFSGVAQTLGAEARRAGLAVPGFRSPPRLSGATRTIRWSPTGGTIVSVVIRGRPVTDVVADMIDGVVAANQLSGERAEVVRGRLRRTVAAAA